MNEPDYAPVLASGVVDDGAAVECGRFIQPKAEAEIALVLDRPLTGPGVTTLEAARAIAGAVAAIEIVDSRIEDWKIKLPDTIADMASSGAVVLSSRLRAARRRRPPPRRDGRHPQRRSWPAPAPAPPRSATRSRRSPGWPTPWRPTA